MVEVPPIFMAACLVVAFNLLVCAMRVRDWVTRSLVSICAVSFAVAATLNWISGS